MSLRMFRLGNDDVGGLWRAGIKCRVRSRPKPIREGATYKLKLRSKIWTWGEAASSPT